MGEPCGTAFEALATRAPAECVVMLDPNIRPGFITDEPAYRARLERLFGRADIVKLSDEDLHWLEGDGAPADLARRILSRGPKLVCITEGAKGATAYHAGGQLSVPARPARVVDTVGAGDTFNAGLLAGLHRAGHLTRAALTPPDEAALETALKLAVAAAAVTVSRAGANPPTAAELGL
jgi:fructokinase